MPKIRKVLVNAFKEIEEIVKDKNNDGKDKIFVGLVTDTFFENNQGSLR